MSFQFYERPKSGSSSVNPPTYTSQWVAQGSADRAFVLAYAIAATPAIVTTPAGILYRQDLRCEPEGRDVFYVTVPYAQLKREVGSYRLSFDTTGGMIHISNSLESIKRCSIQSIANPSPPPLTILATVAEDGNAPEVDSGAENNYGAIGVHGKEVDGIDKYIPALKITATFRHPAAIITLPTIKNLSRYTGCVNSDTFLTFAPGEVLFLGCSGEEGTDCETSVSYTFAMSQNALATDGTALTIGEIVGVEKNGHDVLWIKYHDVVGDSKKVSRRPEAVYVERIYNTIPMALSLGFGS